MARARIGITLLCVLLAASVSAQDKPLPAKKPVTTLAPLPQHTLVILPPLTSTMEKRDIRFATTTAQCITSQLAREKSITLKEYAGTSSLKDNTPITNAAAIAALAEGQGELALTMRFYTTTDKQQKIASRMVLASLVGIATKKAVTQQVFAENTMDAIDVCKQLSAKITADIKKRTSSLLTPSPPLPVVAPVPTPHTSPSP